MCPRMLSRTCWRGYKACQGRPLQDRFCRSLTAPGSSVSDINERNAFGRAFDAGLITLDRGIKRSPWNAIGLGVGLLSVGFVGYLKHGKIKAEFSMFCV